MITPTKHEQLTDSLLVVGHTILKRLKRRAFVAEDLYDAVKAKHNVSLPMFLDTLTFLWCACLIETSDYEIRLKERV
ncbi:hypothetical protein PV379_04020 [Streptomyces caniscabiei]|uniref:ABC-three component system middle component 6 n=1 Tax=Streptomyces caniscabiei TaxID=2746961 RepID=UPI0029A9E678|nr:ABC-three component system middle component 6 [Streptomyces caniscabiei]MDX2776504.1 hypothetical protein [Streptomyces caniscabiei]